MLIPASQASYAVIDTETTGLSAYKGARVIEIAVTQVDAGVIGETWSTLINPGAGVSPGATEIHKITREMLDQAPSFPEIAGDFISRVRGRVLVAHNMRFDMPFIRKEFELAGLEVPRVPQLCTLEGSRFIQPSLPSHRLGDLMAHFGLTFDGWHAAGADVNAAAKILLTLIDLVPSMQVESDIVDTWPDVPARNLACTRAA